MNQLSCEGQLQNVNQPMATAAALLVVIAAIVLICIRRNRDRMSDMATRLYWFISGIFIVLAVALAGQWEIARYFATTLFIGLYMVFLFILSSPKAQLYVHPYIAILVAVLYLPLLLCGLLFLDLSTDIALIVLLALPVVTGLVYLIMWIACGRGNECLHSTVNPSSSLDCDEGASELQSANCNDDGDKVHVRGVGERGFFIKLLIVMIVALVFFSLDLWLCNNTTKYGFYAIFVLLHGYFVIEMATYATFIYALEDDKLREFRHSCFSRSFHRVDSATTGSIGTKKFSMQSSSSSSSVSQNSLMMRMDQ